MRTITENLQVVSFNVNSLFSVYNALSFFFFEKLYCLVPHWSAPIIKLLSSGPGLSLDLLLFTWHFLWYNFNSAIYCPLLPARTRVFSIRVWMQVRLLLPMGRMEVGLEIVASFDFLGLSPIPVLQQTFTKAPCVQSSCISVTREPGAIYCSAQNSSACTRESFCHYGDVPTL